MTLKEMLQSKEAKKIYKELVKKFHLDISKKNSDKIKVINNLKNAKEIKDKEIINLYNKWIKKNIKFDDISNTSNITKKLNILKKWSENIKNNYPVVSSVYVLRIADKIKIIFSCRKKMELKNIILKKADTFNSENQLEKEFKKKLEEVF